MERSISRFSIASILAFCLVATLSACSEASKPTITSGTTFEQVSPGSRLYQETPKDRPMVADYKRGDK